MQITICTLTIEWVKSPMGQTDRLKTMSYCDSTSELLDNFIVLMYNPIQKACLNKKNIYLTDIYNRSFDTNMKK